MAWERCDTHLPLDLVSEAAATADAKVISREESAKSMEQIGPKSSGRWCKEEVTLYLSKAEEHL